MLDYQKLLRFFDEYISHYHEVLKFETAKLRMISEDNIEALGGSISKEQAYIMKTNALENRRLELLTPENRNKSLSQIIESAPAEYKSALEARQRDLSQVIFQIKNVNTNAQEIVAKRLEMLEHIGGTSAETYNKSGVKSRAAQGTMTLNKDI